MRTIHATTNVVFERQLREFQYYVVKVGVVCVLASPFGTCIAFSSFS